MREVRECIICGREFRTKASKLNRRKTRSNICSNKYLRWPANKDKIKAYRVKNKDKITKRAREYHKQKSAAWKNMLEKKRAYKFCLRKYCSQCNKWLRPTIKKICFVEG